MSAWDVYTERLKVNGTTRREAMRIKTNERLTNKLLTSLSYKQVLVDGMPREVAITDEDDFDIKNIFSMPGETLRHGCLVEWEDSRWLITEMDAHNELYTKARMLRCNYLLKWINPSGQIVERWCVVEDGTKYLIGEKATQMMSIGDARIAITIGKDDETRHIRRGMRFVVDDLDVDEPLVYQLTKPNRLFNIYNGEGVFRYILNEVNATDDDNLELRIADYYTWLPKKDRPESDVHTEDTFEEIVKANIAKEESKPEDIEERAVWI